MGPARYKIGKAGLALAHLAFRIALYACLLVLLFWAGREAYTFGFQVFNQQAMSPGEGIPVTVAIPTGATDMEIARILEERGLISNALVFWVQEYLSGYHGALRGGSYSLSTAYTPTRMMSILAGEEEEEAEEGS